MARVLLVDDSPTQASEARFLLEDAGFDVDVAGDGLEALESLGRCPPDVIVTDLMMPRMDGLALVEAVRRDHPTVPVVLVTAHGSEDIAAKALVAGAASYVPKRNLAQDLARVLRPIIAMAAPDPDQVRVLGSLEEIRLRYCLDNDDSLVAPLIRRLEGLVLEMGVCERPDLVRLGVALQEAVVNAIDHGNLELDSELRQDDERVYHELGERRKSQPPYRDRRVRLDAGITRDEASFTVRDEGPGFDPSKLPDPTDPANLFRIGGRGLLLIRTLMDEVRFNATGNEIVLIKRRGRPASTGA
ncbi:Luminescence regulatory protein LuxO [Aquisphaera giovannonii]|uniref:Luminescence regulatory protein LuxO n=1 Tax=Aquisphaera giovannonii TaxID=406548 RepID=A0A5B9W8J5_9BACT|nr:response regulator [Aquisphaera giovannonii]QEH36331.1 Luminescence regulatory protein LuxO [Aquisphaera giovannonii]